MVGVRLNLIIRLISRVEKKGQLEKKILFNVLPVYGFSKTIFYE